VEKVLKILQNDPRRASKRQPTPENLAKRVSTRKTAKPLPVAELAHNAKIDSELRQIMNEPRKPKPRRPEAEVMAERSAPLTEEEKQARIAAIEAHLGIKKP
jgi:hypothetical protein